MFAPVALLDSLNSREDAALLWILVAGGFALWKLPDLRPQLLSMLRILLGPKLLLGMWIPATVYVGLVVAGAWAAGLWHTFSFKETAYWFVGTGLFLTGKATQSHGDPAELKKLVGPALRLTIFLEFFVNLYVLPLAFELLILPLMVLLVGAGEIAKRDPKLDPAGKAINGMVGAVGMALLVFVAVSVIVNVSDVFTRETAERILVAPILTVALIPFLYFVALWGTYEHVFIHFGIYGRDKRSIRRAKWALVRVCRLNLRKVGRLSHRFFPLIRSVEPDADVTELVRRFESELRAAEQEEHERAA